MTAPYPRIPYGEADIRRIRLRGWLYVDKTQYRGQHQPEPPLQRDARLHGVRGAGLAGAVPGLRRVRPERGRGPRCHARVYNGYRFAKNVETDMYNTDMVLYYLKQSVPNEPPPDDPIDVNVRIDYGKLRHLLTVSREAGASLNGNFDLLRQAAGEGAVDANISSSFPLSRLSDRDNFLSLLHYFGLLSIRPDSRDRTRLGIPNQTVRRLLYGHLRDGWRDAGVFDADVYRFSNLVADMAYEGAWRPAIEHLRDAVDAQTGIRDYLDGEKVVHAFMAAHFGMVGYFVIHSERELNMGYADLHLEPFLGAYPNVAYGYVIELKYLKRSETVDAATVKERLDRAKAQLRQYLADEGLRRFPSSVRHIGLALVFHGWELVASEAVERA